jgi:hypothetical protein
LKKLLSLAVAGALALAIGVGVGSAASGYSLFGDATIVTPGNASGHAVQASWSSTGGAYGGVNFAVPSGMTVSQVVNLATDYQFTVGTCGGGAPRFEIGTPSGNIFVYIGPPPSYTGCPPNVWSNTGNLVTPASLVDATQVGGTFYEPWSAVVAAYGSYPVTGIDLVVDGFGPDITAQFDNTQINSTTYTYEPPTPSSAADCKNGGWKNVYRADGSAFKNQGDCIQYVNTGK